MNTVDTDTPSVVKCLPPERQALLEQLRFKWRLRQRWHRAEKSLRYQAIALLRSVAPPDETSEATKKWAKRVYEAAFQPYDDAHSQEERNLKLKLALDRRRKTVRKYIEVVDAEAASSAAVGADLHYLIAPFLRSRLGFLAQRELLEGQIGKIAVQLPVWRWVETVPGFGPLSLAGIASETIGRDADGVMFDLGGFRTIGGLYKRLGSAIVDGRRQRKVRGEEALKHGYDAERHTLAYLLGINLMKQGQRNVYRALYDVSKERELTRCQAIASDPELVKLYMPPGATKNYAPGLHAHYRAQRAVYKRCLCELRAAWRAIDRNEEPKPAGHYQLQMA